MIVGHTTIVAGIPFFSHALIGFFLLFGFTVFPYKSILTQKNFRSSSVDGSGQAGNDKILYGLLQFDF
jgi:ATP/ADP translocase